MLDLLFILEPRNSPFFGTRIGIDHAHSSVLVQKLTLTTMDVWSIDTGIVNYVNIKEMKFKHAFGTT